LNDTLALLERADHDQGWFAALNHDIATGGPTPEAGPSPWDPAVHGLEVVARRRAVMPPAWRRGWADYITQQLLRTDVVLWKGPSPAEVRASIQGQFLFGGLRRGPAPTDTPESTEDTP
jgi:hypothetical protein